MGDQLTVAGTDIRAYVPRESIELGGQATIAGTEWWPVDRLHFAGEHTAPYPRRGTMNGAVLSGERAAREVITAAA